MINHVAKSVQIIRNGLEIEQRDLAQLCSIALVITGRKERCDEDRTPPGTSR